MRSLLASVALLCAAARSPPLSSFAVFPRHSIPNATVQAGVGPEECIPSFANSTLCTNITVPTLVPFLVPGSDSCVIIAPGGGFHGLAYSTEGTEIANWLNSLGISAFVLKYRVPSAFGYNELPLMDAQRAIRAVRSRATELGLNTSRVGFMGFSAGGDIAAAVSSTFAKDSYTRMDSVDQLSSRPDYSLLVYPAVHEWSNKITPDHPPAFFAQAENDPVDANLTVQYYLKLRSTAARAPSDLHIFHGDIHGYGLCIQRDSEGRIPVLIAPPDGPGLMPAWKPWTSVCLWPAMAEAFLTGLGLVHDNHFATPAPL